MEGAKEVAELYCSSDDEVFYGPITTKEIKKALKLRRRTKVLQRTSECRDEPLDNISAGEEDILQNLTLPVEIYSCNEGPTQMWKHRSFDVLLDCGVNDDSREAETPAPPPSPEFSRYNGSPYPTPCSTRRQLCSSLKGIAEEEGYVDEVDKQRTPVHVPLPRYSNMELSRHWRNMHMHLDYSEGSNDSLLMLSKLDDSLVESTSKLALEPIMTSKEAMETPALSGEMRQMLHEDRKVRGLLIEKMEEHEARTQQLRSFKKQPSGVSGVCKQPSLSKKTSDGLINSNDDQEDFLLNEDIYANENEFVKKDTSKNVCSEFKSIGKDYQLLVPGTLSEKSGSCHFSGVVINKHFASPVVGSVGCHDDALSQSISLDNLECSHSRQRVDQAFAAHPSQACKDDTTHNHKLDDVYFMAPARPPTPEFDIEVPEQKALLPSNRSYSYISGDYSLISEADDCLDASRDKDVIEAPDGNSIALGNAVVSADEDGGFLSVLSAAALYHASLKHTGDNVGLTEDNVICSQNAQEKFQCPAAPPAHLSIFSKCDDVEKHVTFHSLPKKACGEYGEEGEEQVECPDRDLTNASVDDDHSLLSSIQEGSVLGGSTHSNEGSCCREMDARSDLNDNDKRHIGGMNAQESCSAEAFNDTLEEMEMLLKYGMDYMLSGNDMECPDVTDKQTVCHNMSTPNKPMCEMSEFEDFGDAINEGKKQHHVAYDVETCSENHNARPEASMSSLSHNNSKPSPCGVVCGNVESVSADVVHDNLFVKPQSMPSGKFHSKLQAVVSQTLNLQPCQAVRNNKASPFKIPVKAVPHTTSIAKLTPVKNAKKCPLKPITTVSPNKRSLNYKKIVSPVGAYIHNIPSPSLITTVKPNPVHAGTPKRTMLGGEAAVMSRDAAVSGIEKSPHVLEQKGRENVDTSNIQPVLPVVSYKSVPSVKLEQSQQEKMPRLNEKMKKLVNTPKPHVLRHEGRVKVMASPRTPNVKVTSSKKLVTDFVSSSMASSDADAEISVVVRKEVTRTHTLGV